MLVEISALGYQGKRTAFGVHCRKLVAELGIAYTPRRNVTGVPVAQKKVTIHYVLKTDLIKYIWLEKEIPQTDLDFILNKYPSVAEIKQCVQDFRTIYSEKSLTLLSHFIERYSKSKIKPINSFSAGLNMDLDAVKNSVISELNNGFVEGINNKIKVIKRLMFGRAKLDLLRVRVIFAR